MRGAPGGEEQDGVGGTLLLTQPWDVCGETPSQWGAVRREPGPLPAAGWGCMLPPPENARLDAYGQLHSNGS